MLAIYVSIMCLFLAIDTIVWSNNFNIITPVWCDIETHVGVASLVGIPACTLVITRRLCKIIQRRSFVISKRSKRNELIFDLGVTVGFPIVITILYYIVQGARFEVLEELGCSPNELDSGLTIILSNVWPLLLPAISVLFYSPRILWFFYRQRKEIGEFLDSNQTLNRADYYRIMAVGCMDALILLPIGIYDMVIDVLQGRPLPFWTGWTFVHTDWEAYGLPTSSWDRSIWDKLVLRWDEVINPALAIVFFLIFGLTKEARANYWSALYFFLRPLGIKSRTKAKAEVSTAVFHTNTYDSSRTNSSEPSDLPEVEEGGTKPIFFSTHSRSENSEKTSHDDDVQTQPPSDLEKAS